MKFSEVRIGQEFRMAKLSARLRKVEDDAFEFTQGPMKMIGPCVLPPDEEVTVDMDQWPWPPPMEFVKP